MKFTIHPKIFEMFHELNVGIVIAKDIDNSGIVQDIITKIRHEENRMRVNYNTETLSQEPKINSWRSAYSLFGAKPKENRSSVENLYRLVLNGKEIRHISKLVDIYNLVSLKHMLPLGGEDLDKTEGDIELTFAGNNEPPVVLLGDKDARPPHEGEVIYKDSLSTICRRFNWREADRTKLTEETKSCILVIEGLPPATKEDVEKATSELAGYVKEHCNAKTESFMLNKEKGFIQF